MATKVQTRLTTKQLDCNFCQSVFEAHAPRVQALCDWMASSSNEAQAISMEIFVQCFRQLSSMPDGEAVEILDRQMIGVFQDRYFRPTAIVEESAPSQADEMRSAIRSMAPMERLVFLLHDVYGYAVSRVAELTGLGEKECCRSVFQGRMHVRAALA